MRDVEATIISQYADSPTLVKLVQNMNEYIRPDVDIDNLYNFIWNVKTAQGFGLDIWGRIVGVDRNDYPVNGVIMSDPQFLELVLLKALSNISASTIPAINQLLRNWVGTRGRCYCQDLGHMAMLYVFEFYLEPFEIAIITNSGIFLRPAGVQAMAVNNATVSFGFREGGTRAYTGFNQAPFVRTYAVS